jgi:hypothetical protein
MNIFTAPMSPIPPVPLVMVWMSGLLAGISLALALWLTVNIIASCLTARSRRSRRRSSTRSPVQAISVFDPRPPWVSPQTHQRRWIEAWNTFDHRRRSPSKTKPETTPPSSSPAHLKDYGVSEDMAVDLMAEHWLPRCEFSWPVEDAVEWLKMKARNAYEYGERPIGDLHPMADFAGVKLPPAEYSELAPRAGRKWFHHGEGMGRVDWLYYGMLPKVGVGVLLAPSQAGKTFVAIHLAHSLATGQRRSSRKPPMILAPHCFSMLGPRARAGATVRRPRRRSCAPA